MKKYHLTAVILTALTVAGCGDSGTSKPKSAGAPAPKSASTPAPAAKEAPKSVNTADIEGLKKEIAALQEKRVQNSAKYTQAMASYQKIREELISIRRSLKQAEDAKDTQTVEKLMTQAKPFLEIEAAAVKAHQEGVELNDSYTQKNRDLAAIQSVKKN